MPGGMEAGTAYVTILPDMSRFGRDLNRQVSSSAAAAGRDAGRSTGTGFGAGLLRTVGALGIGAGIAGAVGTGLQTAMDNELADVKFTQLLGSAGAAKAFIADMQSFAASTPFEFPGLQNAAARFLAVGTAADDVIPIMTTLGDATSMMGTGEEGIDRATTALTQMQQKGKVTGEEMMQLTEAGIPAWDALASALGKTVPQAQALVSDGLVPAEAMFTALKDRSGESLQAMAGGMDKASATLAGQWSTLKDTASQALGSMFTAAMPVMKGFVSFLADPLIPAVQSAAAVLGRVAAAVWSWRVPIAVVAGAITAVFLPALIATGVQSLIAGSKAAAGWLLQKVSALGSLAAQAAVFAALGVHYLRLAATAMLSAGRTAAAWLLQRAPMVATLALTAVTFAAIVAGWIASAVAAMANAVIIAAAWLVAFWPVALVIAVILAVIAVVWVFWDQIKAALTKAWQFVRRTFTVLWTWVKGIFTKLWQSASDLWGRILQVVRRTVDTVRTVVVGTWQRMRDTVVGVFESLKSKVASIWAAITGIVRSAVDSVAGIASGIWDGVKGAMNFGVGLLNRAIGGFNVLIGAVNKVPGVQVPMLPSLPYLAEGGIVTRPTLAVVGEAGPEAVVPLSRLGTTGAAQPIWLQVTIGDRDITDMITDVTRSEAGRLSAQLLAGRRLA